MLIVVLLQILIVIWLIRHLIRGDKGPREPFFPVVYAGLLGVFAVAIAGIINAFTIPIIGLPLPGESTANISLFSFIIGCLAIGVTEELSKALPLKNFLQNKAYFNEVGDGIIFFGITGMVFGALENLMYAATFGSDVGLMRILTVPFMHAGLSCIIGYAVARRKVLGRPQWTVSLSFTLAIGLHALYNFGIFYNQPWSRYLSLALVIIINYMIFFLYKRARRTDAAEVPKPVASP